MSLAKSLINPEPELKIEKVFFEGSELISIKDLKTDKGYGAIKWLCNGIGLNDNQTRNQFIKIQADPVLSKGVKIFSLPSYGGQQETICLEWEFIPLWLAKINVKIIKDSEIRERLISYQFKVKEILSNVFIKKLPNEEAKNTFKLPGDYLEALKQLVASEEEKKLLVAEKTKALEEKQIVVNRLEQARPKIAMFEAMQNSENLKTLTQLGYKLKKFGLGPKVIFKWLREKSVLTTVNNTNYPRSNYDKHFKVISVNKKRTDINGKEKIVSFDVLCLLPSAYDLIGQLAIQDNKLMLSDWTQLDFSDMPNYHEENVIEFEVVK